MVDDDAILLDLYREVLSEDFHVLTASTVVEAIELLSAGQVCAVGCDYYLNNELGLDIVTWIDSHCPELLEKTLLISGEPSPHTRGFNVRCLYKPVPMDELLDVFYRWFAPVERSQGDVIRTA